MAWYNFSNEYVSPTNTTSEQCCQLSPNPAMLGLVTITRASPSAKASSLRSLASRESDPRTSTEPGSSFASRSASWLVSHHTVHAASGLEATMPYAMTQRSSAVSRLSDHISVADGAASPRNNLPRSCARSGSATRCPSMTNGGKANPPSS